MTRALRAVAGMFAGLGVLSGSIPAGQAAGAMAIGACAAYGYAFDYRDVGAARTAAQGRCVGSGCKVVATLNHSCAAFAIDGHRPCGAHGFAAARGLGDAENTALQTCYKSGGRDCVIRAFACDTKG
jgi:Domain of unknown function (DUF4189)